MMPAEFREDQTWVGFAIKGGGILFVVGMEGAEGVAGRLDQFKGSLNEFNITSVRMGLGLGGGVGLSMFLAFNTPMLFQLDGTKISPALRDFNVNISVEAKIPLGNSFKMIRPIASKLAAGSKVLGGLKSGLGNLSMSDLSTLRDFAHLYWNATVEASDAANTRDPKTMMIDIPGAGAGLELSLFWTQGEISVS